LKKVKAYINIVRPINFLITFATVVVATALSFKFEYSIVKVIMAALSASLTLSAGNVINDIYDLNGDKINHPSRPLPLGIISINAALIYYYILLTGSLILSLFVSNLNFTLNLLAIILLYLYSVKIKKIVLGGNLVIAFLTGLTFIYGGIAVNNITYSIMPALYAFLINLIREIVKDMEDTEGDMIEGIVSFSSRYSIKTAKNIILGLSILLILLTFLPYKNGNYNSHYISMIIALFIPTLIYCLFSLIKDDSRKNLNKLSNILKLDMVFGLIALYIGK
jgi:geranylgeranylglycerol-phosphate geranylgeranyltransferase